MRRRTVVLGAAAGAMFAAAGVRAQQPGRSYRVGALLGGGSGAMQVYRAALRERLASHGFVEGRNLEIEARGATAVFHEDRNMARELLARKPDAILTCLTRVTEAAQSATKSVPIVFAWVADPVFAGIVKHNAKPGANATGVTNRFSELLVKRLELLLELVPGVKRVGVPGANWSPFYRAIGGPLRKAAAQLDIALVETSADLVGWISAIDAAVNGGAQGLVPFGNFVAQGQIMSRDAVIQHTKERRIPTVFSAVEMTERGALVSYGTNLVNDVRRAADLLAQVLKGADPAELPVDQAARFELAVNLRTARSIGVTVPRSVLLRADRVIE